MKGSQQQHNDNANLGEDFARLQATLAAAAVQPQPWAARVVEAVYALLRFASAEQEKAAALLTPYMRDCSDDEAWRYQALIADLAALFREGRDERPTGQLLPASNEQALAGAICCLVAERIRIGEGDHLMDLSTQLIEFTLTPYIGLAEAKHWTCVEPRGGNP